MKGQFIRRDFLEMGTAVAVGLTANRGYVGPTSCEAADNPNRTIRIGLIGSGGRGRSLLGCAHTLHGVEARLCARPLGFFPHSSCGETRYPPGISIIQD